MMSPSVSRLSVVTFWFTYTGFPSSPAEALRKARHCFTFEPFMLRSAMHSQMLSAPSRPAPWPVLRYVSRAFATSMTAVAWVPAASPGLLWRAMARSSSRV